MNFPLTDLARLVASSTILQELDISGNDCQPLHFPDLLKALAFNKVIHNLNLSWNKIIHPDDWHEAIPDKKLVDFTLQYMFDERDMLPTLIHSESSRRDAVQKTNDFEVRPSTSSKAMERAPPWATGSAACS